MQPSEPSIHSVPSEITVITLSLTALQRVRVLNAFSARASPWRLILLSLAFSLSVHAQTDSPSPSAPSGAARTAVVPPEKAAPIRLVRFDKPPVIDGKLDDEVWKHASVFQDFYQWRPSDTQPASAKTEAFAGYDSRFIYFAFHCYDDPTKVRATVAKRDAILDDDAVGIILDTFNDQRRAYELLFNPLGVQQDGILTEGGNDDFSVDIVMESKGVITEDGYTVEIAIPFKSLRYEAGKEKQWGVHFVRLIKHFNGETDSWMPISQNQNGLLNQEGHITGLEGISTERTLELIPSLTVSETGKRVPTLSQAQLNANPSLLDPGRFVNPRPNYDLGLNLKFSFTPNITLDAAINPDFAQVEADQTVVTVNQRFPIFFEEKRPFFLEGKDYFQTPIQAVHTRAIINPQVAVKLTGKRARNTFGVLLAADKAPGSFTDDEIRDPNQFPQIQRFIGKKAYIGIVRLKRDLGKENSIGLLFTSYSFIEKHNQLLGLDGRFRVNPQTIITFQAIGTQSRRCFFNPAANAYQPGPSSPCFSGFQDINVAPKDLAPNSSRHFYRTGNAFAYAFEFNNETRHWDRNYEARGRTRDYRADLGFTRRTNTNNGGYFLRYKSEPKPKARLINWRLSNSTNYNFDFQGRMQNWNNNSQLQLRFQHESFLGLGFDRGYERLFEEEFGPKRTATQPGTFAGNDSQRSTQQKDIYVYTGSTPSKKYNFFLLGTYNWNQFDLDFGAGPRYPRVSPRALIDSNAPQDPGPGSQIHLEGNLTFQPTKAWSNSLNLSKDRLVRNDTGRIAFDDNIVSLRSTYQFTRFIFFRSRVDFESIQSRVRGQFLMGWTPNPGTALYVGYNDDLTRNGFSPFTGKLEPGFRRNGRTFFIKMSYLFRRSFGK